jgi:glycosidase
MNAFLTWSVLGILNLLCSSQVVAQDSVDVTFRYAVVGKTSVTVPGEFNSWNNAAAPMTNAVGDVWVRTIRLRSGGNPSPPASGVPGAWQYKFYYSGASPWPNDPLNHHQNAADNNNTFIYVRDPTIYQFIPNQRTGIQSTSMPTISAYIFPKVGGAVDTSTLRLEIDGVQHTGLGTMYNPSTGQFVFTPSVPLTNGDHSAILRAGTTSDTVQFTTRAGYVQITTRAGFTTVAPVRTIRGLVQDTVAMPVWVVRNGTDTTAVLAAGGRWTATDTLTAGTNIFRALTDSAGVRIASDPVAITYAAPQAPLASVTASLLASAVMLDAGASFDPQGFPIAGYEWLDDPAAPLGLAGKSGSSITVPLPSVPGEYYFGLIVHDQEGLADTIRSLFILTGDGTVVNPTIAMSPEWARKARVYFLFPKAASAVGTINGAAQRLTHIRDMGFSVIWLMPVMVNAYPINNGTGPGYNISDYYNVAPEYGTNQDFRNFVAQAHTLGLKVILDITTNHSSRSHPWAIDGRAYGQDSPYWTWYEHSLIAHNTNGLGQSTDQDGFTYYSGFSSQLLNLNWADPDLRHEMIRMMTYWIREFGIDGYRFDVYWGPHRRYGEAAMGKPVRDALKRVKPDILLLGEDDGTGSGTETIYADHADQGVNGGVDAAYDFKLYFNQIRNFSNTAGAVTALHSEIDNAGYFPGEHALYMRFMESQDEDRIVYFYSGMFQIDAATTFRKTMPLATVLFTAPGFPMLWNGQEVGWGYGITGSKEDRARSVINWNYQGRGVLAPHYQKLATLRGVFPAFTEPKRDTNSDGRVDASDQSIFLRIPSSNALVYGFVRPYLGQNGVTVVNVSGEEQSAVLDMSMSSGLLFPDDIKAASPVYLNDLLSGEGGLTTLGALSAVNVTLPAYGSKVFLASLTNDSLKIANPILNVDARDPVPLQFTVYPNYPNPFNPSTVISFDLPVRSRVTVVVHDMLGREVARLLDAERESGLHRLVWDARANGRGAAASGVYYARVTAVTAAGTQIETRAMVLLK